MAIGEPMQTRKMVGRHFADRRWVDRIATAAFFVLFAGPIAWLRIFATKEQTFLYVFLLVASLEILGPTRHRHSTSCPLCRVIRRNVLCHMGRIDLEDPVDRGELNESDDLLGHLRREHPWVARLVFVVVYASFCAVYLHLVLKGTKQDIDICLVALLIVHLMIRSWGGKAKDDSQSQPSAR